MGSNQLSNPPGVFVHGDTTVPRQTRSRTSSAAPPADSRHLKFASRADQLQLRGRRNFDRYMRVIKNYVAADGPCMRSGRRSPLRTPCGMPNGTSVMALYPVARGFSTGGTRENFRRCSYHRQTRTSGDEAVSTRILKFVSRAEHLAWRGRWKTGAGSSCPAEARKPIADFEVEECHAGPTFSSSIETSAWDRTWNRSPGGLIAAAWI